MPQSLLLIVCLAMAVIVVGLFILLVKCYRKVAQGTALVRTGMGGARVSTSSGMVVVPVLHRAEPMDISVKRIEIARQGEEGLICKDNLRADIKVAFFVRVNNTERDILQVAQSLGCVRASEQKALVELFDAKFSEALKTVGKKFDFVDLYNERDRFKEAIVQLIGTELNGYVLDDSAIDFLEQTPLDKLDKNNILDAEGIKKITDLTARQQILANQIERDKEKTMTKQNVEAREAILELERQKAEAEARQQREVETVRAREQAETVKVKHEERLKAERARLATEEEVKVVEENVQRQVIVAQRNKERTDAVETERIEKDRLLERTERERIVALAQIDKDKAIEVERRAIQEVIRDRVIVERGVVEEEEKMQDTKAFAAAERQKQVALTTARQTAEEAKIVEVEAAEAAKQAASRLAEQQLIAAEAERGAAAKHTEAKKLLAEAKVAEDAASGLAEAEVMRAKATALEKQGAVEASVLQQKYHAEAAGIKEKADAMKLFDEASKAHEEFRLRLEKEKAVEIESLRVNNEIAKYQAMTIGTALKSAKIDIVGGDTVFFEKIVGAIGNGKSVDRLVEGSRVLSDVRHTFFNGNAEHFRTQLQEFVSQFGMDSNDLKNLSISALIAKMLTQTEDGPRRQQLVSLLDTVWHAGLGNTPSAALNLAPRNGQPV
jgi:uncharacterized membrane protein YqiK